MIDQKITAAHQWIVNVSERQPKWWAEHAAWVHVAIGLATSAATLDGGLSVVLAALNLAGATMWIWMARVPFLLAGVGSSGMLRLIVWTVVVIRMAILTQTTELLRVAQMVEDLAGLSFLYFAACRPPPPRNRRRQAVVQGSTA